MSRSLQTATLYCDAAWDHQLKDGGWGIYCRSDKGKFVGNGPLPDYCNDNNTAELAAIFAGMYRICTTWVGTEIIYVRTDSRNAFNLATSYSKCPREDAARLQEKIWDLKKEKNVKLQLGWVKGHQKADTVQAWCNSQADRLARLFLEDIRRRG